MKRAIILLSFVSFQLSAISVREYIAQHGQPQIVSGYLDLSRKNITSLDGLELLENPLSITNLNLSGNKITTLPLGIFNNLTNLRSLALDSNNLTELPAGIFDNLINLKNLYLSLNKLTALPVGIFDNLTHLEKLYLWNNLLQETTQELKEKYLGVANRNKLQLEFKTPEQEAQEAIFNTVQKFAKQKVPLLKHVYVQVINNIRRLASDIRNEENRSIAPLRRDEDGNTLMHLAIMTGDYELIKLLADTLPEFIILKNEKRETPLHTAILSLPADTNTRQIIEFLVQTNPQLIDIKNENGLTPIDLAVEHNPEMLNLLLNIAYKILPEEPQASTSSKKESKP